MPIKCTINETKGLAQVWMSHADQEDAEMQKKLNDFIAECRAKKIFVCVYESGDKDLLECTKELLAYNYNNQCTRSTAHRANDRAR